jgi:adenosylmethionine-8-amino-7-oxononanoate aminotransferase
MGDTMTTTDKEAEQYFNDGVDAQVDEAHALAEKARRHTWLHFSNMGGYGPDHEIPVMVRGEGAYIYDSRGKRYMDGIASLFTSQLGHGQAELAEAAAEQAKKLAFFPLWTYAHPNAINLAAKLASLAPGDLNRVFFTSGGAESVESAWKLARQYHHVRGDHGRYKVISRDIAYHGTTLGALSITSIQAYRAPFEPLVGGAVKVPNTNFYRAPEHGDDVYAFGRWAADEIERAIEREGAESVAAVFIEPVQNAGGCFVPPPGYLERVREICTRHGVLLVFDETITAFGRLGEWFGAIKYGVTPDIITFAKGLTSAYSPLGAMIVSDKVFEPFSTGEHTFLHGFTFAGHPVSTAVALKNIEIFERDDILGHVRRNAPVFRAALEDALGDLAIVGDIRGEGFFYGIELVKDRETKETFNDEEADRLLRGYLSGALYEKGLICRSDDRGDPVVQLAPPLISGEIEFEFMASVLRDVLSEARKKI